MPWLGLRRKHLLPYAIRLRWDIAREPEASDKRNHFMQNRLRETRIPCQMNVVKCPS